MIRSYTLFPTPLKLVGNFITDKERKEILKLTIECYQNQQSSNLKHSSDVKSLLDTIKKRAEDFCTSLGEDLFGQQLKWKIMNMWKNSLNKNGFQYVHNHCNSFISGIIYVNLPKGSPKTKFYRPETLSHFIFSNYNTNSKTNIFNSEWTEIPETNQLDMILFPSYIKHSVDLMEVDEERVTLAFNAIPNKLSNGPYDIEFKL
jgi:uncharacterized protein (TIGR02466 family)